MTVPVEPITTAILHDLFRFRGILTEDSKFEDGRMMKWPNTDAIEKLASICEGMRINAEAFTLNIPAQLNDFIDVLRAVALLHEELPELFDERHGGTAAARVAALGAPPRVVAATEAETRAWERLWRAVVDVKQVLSSRYSFDRAVLKPLTLEEKSKPVWHEFVDHLTESFKEAMRSTNPDHELRFSNTGPLSRFLEAIFPLITGESVKGSSALQYLRRTSQQG